MKADKRKGAFVVPKKNSSLSSQMRWILQLSLLLAAQVTSYSNSEETTESAVRLLWHSQMKSQEMRENAVAIALLSDGDVVVGGTAVPDKRPLEPSFWIRRINHDGEVIRTTQIQNVSTNSPRYPRYPYVAGLIGLETSDYLSVIDFKEGSPNIALLSPEGKIRSMLSLRELIGTKEDVRVDRLSRLGGGTVLVVGGLLGDALLLKTDLTISDASFKRFDFGGSDFLTDAVNVGPGTNFLVGTSQIANGPEQKAYTIYALILGPESSLVVKTNFPGRLGKISLRDERTVCLAYDASTAKGQDLRVRAIDVNLKTLWETKIASVERGLTKIHILPRDNEEFIVVASVDSKLLVASVRKDGIIKWKELVDLTSPTWTIDGACLKGEDLTVLYPFFAKTSQKRSIEQVGLSRFRLLK